MTPIIISLEFKSSFMLIKDDYTWSHIPAIFEMILHEFQFSNYMQIQYIFFILNLNKKPTVLMKEYITNIF